MANSAVYSDEDVSLSLQNNWQEVLPSEVEAERDAASAEDADEPAADDGVAMWYPDADQSISMHVRGNYASRYPIGAVVHFTAGRNERGDTDAERTMIDGKERGFLYFCMSSTGKVYQPAPLNKWGSHCGVSTYPTLGSSLSNKLAGIEICCAGRCTPSTRGYEPWWNELYSADSPKRTFYKEEEVRKVVKEQNITSAGHYHRYTAEQEASLHKLLLWLHQNNPQLFKVDNIVGHDEISPDRKNDPGGALSEFMKDLRARIKQMASASGV